MITAEDVVLAISNSGETAEVVGAVTHIRKIGARIVALTATQNPPLAVPVTQYCIVLYSEKRTRWIWLLPAVQLRRWLWETL